MLPLHNLRSYDPQLSNKHAFHPRYNRTTAALPIIFLCLIVAGSVHNFAAIGAALVISAVFQVSRGKVLKYDNITKIFFIISLFALFRSFLPSQMRFFDQIQESVRFLGVAALSYIISNTNRLCIEKTTIYFSILLAFTLVVYILTGSFSVRDFYGTLRFSSFFPHANHLGYSCSAIIIGLIYSRNKIQMVAAVKLFVFSVLVISLGASMSSGATLFMLSGLVAVAISEKFTTRSAPYFIVLVLMLAAGTQSDAAQNAISKIITVDLLETVRRADELSFGAQGSSFAWRISYWLALIQYQLDLGYYSTLIGQGAGFMGVGNRNQDFMSHDAHSDFVKIFMEYGLVGVIVIFGLLIKAIRSTRSGFVGYVVVFVPMVAGNSFASAPVMFMIILALALLKKRW